MRSSHKVTAKEINKLEDKINDLKAQIPSDIGNYIMNNLRIHYTTKNGKPAKRRIKDLFDFKKHFNVVEKSKTTNSKDTKTNKIYNKDVKKATK